MIAFLAFVGTTSITIFTAGSGLVAVPLVIVLVSLPMVYLFWKDVTSLRDSGVRWGRSRWAVYVLAVPLPAYVIFPVYLLVRLSKTVRA
ncbi:hypothetical protein [Salinigranum sp.]|uniref:hypothetical protein n=1 Tax=Salinigranum sp. TaxID=1966351 RepID=UPI0035638405